MNSDRIHPDQRVNPYGYSHWQEKLAMCFFIAAVLLAISMSCAAATRAYMAVMCPPNWQATVSQRYDKRDDLDWIVKRTWRTQCY